MKKFLSIRRYAAAIPVSAFAVSAHAAVPAAVTDALATATTDGVTAAGAVLAVLFTIWGVLLLLKAKKG